MSIRLREYKASDYDALNNLWNLTGMGGSQRGDHAEIIDRSLETGGVLYIMTDQNKLIGSSWITYDGRRLYLHHFAIHPDWQGKGLSKKLIKASLGFAKKEDIQIKLEVHKDNKVATDLYKKYGFQYLGDYDVYIIRDLNKI